MPEVALQGMFLAAVGKAVETREISETLTIEGADLSTRPDQASTPRLQVVCLVLITQNPMPVKVHPMLLHQMTLRLMEKRKRKRSRATAVAAMVTSSLNVPRSCANTVSRLGIIQMTATYSQPPNRS
jgi:hypothetical protein